MKVCRWYVQGAMSRKAEFTWKLINAMNTLSMKTCISIATEDAFPKLTMLGGPEV